MRQPKAAIPRGSRGIGPYMSDDKDPEQKERTSDAKNSPEDESATSDQVGS